MDTRRRNAREDTMARKKILLVDDSNTVLMMERMILNKGSYDLVTARTARRPSSGRRRAARPHPARRDHAADERLRGLQKIREDEA
jgi:response regulator RpfG family c-di-GMP phosphodiesterase